MFCVDHLSGINRGVCLQSVTVKKNFKSSFSKNISSAKEAYPKINWCCIIHLYRSPSQAEEKFSIFSTNVESNLYVVSNDNRFLDFTGEFKVL